MWGANSAERNEGIYAQNKEKSIKDKNKMSKSILKRFKSLFK